MASQTARDLVYGYLALLAAAGALLILFRPNLPLLRGSRHRAVLAAIALCTLGVAAPIGIMTSGSRSDRVEAGEAVCVAGFVVLVIYALWRSSYLKKRHQQANATQRALMVEQGHEAWGIYKAELQGSYAFMLESPSDQETSLLCMTADGSTLRFLQLAAVQGQIECDADLIVPVSEIVSVELVKHEQVVTRSTTQTRKKGAIGRAVVGDVLFGPAGAIVGAVSAGSTSASTGVEHRIYHASELVFGLADLANPVVRFIHDDHGEADRWLHRIRSAMARTRPPAPDRQPTQIG